MKDPICIPVFVEATPDENAPAADASSPGAAGADLSIGAACLS